MRIIQNARQAAVNKRRHGDDRRAPEKQPRRLIKHRHRKVENHVLQKHNPSGKPRRPGQRADGRDKKRIGRRIARAGAKQRGKFHVIGRIRRQRGRKQMRITEYPRRESEQHHPEKRRRQRRFQGTFSARRKSASPSHDPPGGRNSGTLIQPAANDAGSRLSQHIIISRRLI